MRTRRLLTTTCGAWLILASAAQAQTTLNPTGVQWVASPDHAATDPLSGNAVTTSYRLTCPAPQAGAVAITNKDLGKPSPAAGGVIGPVTVAEFATITTGLVYTCTVSAVGPGAPNGVASQPSNPFGRVGAPRAPGAPTAVQVR